MPRRSTRKHAVELAVIAAICGACWTVAFLSDDVVIINRATATDNLYAMRTQLTYYRLEWGEYPPTDVGNAIIAEALTFSKTRTQSGNAEDLDGKIRAQDPWANDYSYRFPGQYGDYDIWSSGSDGVEGTNDHTLSWVERRLQQGLPSCERASHLGPLRTLLASLFWVFCIIGLGLWFWGSNPIK